MVTILANQKVNVSIVDSAKISSLDGNAKIIFNSSMNIGDSYNFTIEEGALPVIQTEDISSLDFFVGSYFVGSLNNLEVNDQGVVLDVNKLLANIELE